MQLLTKHIFTFGTVFDTNFFSSFIGGFAAAYMFWKLFQNKIKKLIDYKETKKLSENFLGELLYNRLTATRNIEEKSILFRDKEMNTLEYETESIYEFFKRKPIKLGNKFYSHLHIFYSMGLKNNNMTLKIFWFSPNLTVVDRKKIKKYYLENSKEVIAQIDKILNNEMFVAHMKTMGLTTQPKDGNSDNI